MSRVMNWASLCGAAAIAFAAPVGVAAGERAASSGQVVEAKNPDAPVIAEFQARVKAYAALHEKLERTLAPLSRKTTPELIASHQRELERLIARERASARRGDIFTERIRAYLRRQLARVFGGPEGRAIVSAIMDEETRAVRLRINGRYPEGVPRSNMPPQVLLVLPRLPEQLEYRFVGERLVLLDIHALTIADFMDDAVPR